MLLKELPPTLKKFFPFHTLQLSAVVTDYPVLSLAGASSLNPLLQIPRVPTMVHGDSL